MLMVKVIDVGIANVDKDYVIKMCFVLVGIVFLDNRARRAVDDALPAGNARNICQVLVKRRTDVRIKAAGVRTDDGNALCVASRNTAAAIDAL